mmetsp:Transcript_8005/g.20179  ORF Transcript_8005/g.20179 Transcript_8005/m.20179 type:complete len:270 (+) Transcript_8005:1457-2266(+)
MFATARAAWCCTSTSSWRHRRRRMRHDTERARRACACTLFLGMPTAPPSNTKSLCAFFDDVRFPIARAACRWEIREVSEIRLRADTCKTSKSVSDPLCPFERFAISREHCSTTLSDVSSLHSRVRTGWMFAFRTTDSESDTSDAMFAMVVNTHRLNRLSCCEENCGLSTALHASCSHPPAHTAARPLRPAEMLATVRYSSAWNDRSAAKRSRRSPNSCNTPASSNSAALALHMDVLARNRTHWKQMELCTALSWRALPTILSMMECQPG